MFNTPAQRRPSSYPHVAMPPPPFYFYHAAASSAPPALFYYAAAVPPPPLDVPVRQVWTDNFDAEMDAVLIFSTRARHVAFSVQYPGVVVHGTPGNQAEPGALTVEKRYAVLKANVDALKPLQLGLAVATVDGRCMAWQINLCGFDPESDPHAPRSVAYLAGGGMDFEAHRLRGVTVARLSMKLHHCGLLRRPGLSWVTYGGAYHVAYLLKMVTGRPLPDGITGFLALAQRFLCGDVYDVARIAGGIPSLPVGLERIAGALGLAPPLVNPRLGGARAVLALQVLLLLGPGFYRGFTPLI